MYNEVTELEFLNPTVGCCQGKLMCSKSGFQDRLLNFFWFSRYGVVHDFFLKKT